MSDPTEFAKEAIDLVGRLLDFTDRVTSKEFDFIASMDERITDYGEETFVSDSQIEWLRDLAIKYAV